MDKLDKIKLVSADLAAEIRDAGTLQQSIVSTSSTLWYQTADLGVTERRETIKADLASLESELSKSKAEIHALTVELETLKFLVDHEPLTEDD